MYIAITYRKGDGIIVGRLFHCDVDSGKSDASASECDRHILALGDSLVVYHTATLMDIHRQRWWIGAWQNLEFSRPTDKIGSQGIILQ